MDKRFSLNKVKKKISKQKSRTKVCMIMGFVTTMILQFNCEIKEKRVNVERIVSRKCTSQHLNTICLKLFFVLI